MVRADKVVTNIFDPAFVLKEDDTLIVLGDTEKLQDIEKEAKALLKESAAFRKMVVFTRQIQD